MDAIKFENPFLAALLFVAAQLLARVAVQGVEQAIFSTAVEWSVTRMGKMRSKLFPKSAAGSR
jgi:uncharacterized membrane protein (UPF0136 family)